MNRKVCPPPSKQCDATLAMHCRSPLIGLMTIPEQSFRYLFKTALVESIVDLIERVILISIEMKMFEAIFVPSWFRALSGVDNNLKFHRLLWKSTAIKIQQHSTSTRRFLFWIFSFLNSRGSPRLSDRQLLKVAKLTFEFVLSQIVVLSSLKALLPFYGFISLQNSRARIICEYLRFLHKRIFLLILPTFVPLLGSFSSVHCA